MWNIDFVPDVLRIQQSSGDMMKLTFAVGSVLFIVVVAGGGALCVVLTLVVLGCCVARRRRQRMQPQHEDNARTKPRWWVELWVCFSFAFFFVNNPYNQTKIFKEREQWSWIGRVRQHEERRVRCRRVGLGSRSRDSRTKFRTFSRKYNFCFHLLFFETKYM